MRSLNVALYSLLVAGCGSHSITQSATQQVNVFYLEYLQYISGSEGSGIAPNLNNFIAKDTLARLNAISKIPGQDIIGSDYFTYTQDYNPDWIKRLKVTRPQNFIGGKTIDVWLGIEDGNNLHLRVYLRHEAGAWKIYRVRDISDNFEYKIFDAGTILQAQWDGDYL